MNITSKPPNTEMMEQRDTYNAKIVRSIDHSTLYQSARNLCIIRLSNAFENKYLKYKQQTSSSIQKNNNKGKAVDYVPRYLRYHI